MRRATRQAGLVLGVVVFSLAAASVGDARTIRVDGSSTAEEEDGSPAAPFKTIAAALSAVRPGDTVVIHEGVYRESLRVPSGRPGKPVTLRAADGQRVVVTGAEKIEGWKPAGDGRYTAVLDWRPDRLFVRGRPQAMARDPEQGWLASTEAGDDWLRAPESLKRLSLSHPLGEVRVWLQKGNVFGTFPLRKLDADKGVVWMEGVKKGRLSDSDKFYLRNRADWVRRAGDWAVEPEGDRFVLTLKPAEPGDLDAVEAPRRSGAVLRVRNASHVRIEGLEVAAGRRMGIEVHGGVRVDVLRCVVHDHGYVGISMRDVRHGSVRQNVVARNEHGVSVSYSQRVTVEENDVGHNRVDGVLVTWKSSDVTVRRNYVHHHLLWGHPDNIQVYRDVRRVRFQENLLLAGGQSIMMEQTRDGVVEGNMLVGSGAVMLILGHENAGHYRIAGNTFAMSGYGCMNLTWEDYEVNENVFFSGHGSALYGVRGIPGYRADRNLFWNSDRAEQPTILAADAGWLKDLAAVQESTGQDAHSVYANPRLRNAPIAFGVLDTRRLHDSTREKWYMRGGTALFRKGDHVEVNFDGVVRRVNEVEEETIAVSPGLDELPLKGWLVANWGECGDFRLDLRLREGSPGAKLASGGEPVGSRIDVGAYQRGDFNGDGRRDLPVAPPELRALRWSAAGD